MKNVGFGNLHHNAILLQVVPEPATVALLILAGLALLRRRPI